MAATDFIQMYSWDKKLELWVGRSLGLAPEQYKRRVISAMEEYFPLVSYCCYLLQVRYTILICSLGARPLDEAARFTTEILRPRSGSTGSSL
jgi:hypothetical protein